MGRPRIARNPGGRATVAGRLRRAARRGDDRGVGAFATAIGFLVFLLFLFFAMQVIRPLRDVDPAGDAQRRGVAGCGGRR